VQTYIAEVPAERREAITKLRILCRHHLIGYEECIDYGMPCYKRDGVLDVSFASQKQYIALYIQKIATVEAFRDLLPTASIGKSCIRFANPNKDRLRSTQAVAPQNSEVQKEERVTRGRIVFVFLLVCSLTALGSVSAQQRDASHAGWISDESCGTQHTKPGRTDCVQKCWRGGASVGHPEWKPQRAVFVADDDRGIWIVENPEAVRNFPAARVVVTGKFDSAKKTIHVEKITPSAQ
jgi:uncharacterized protein YdhG (YjbR/CyaY superfamily)